MTNAAPRLAAIARLLPLPAVAACALAGGIARLLAAPAAAGWLWSAGTLLVLLVLLSDAVGKVRRGEWGLDVIAALAMGGGLALGETLAACIIALMYAGGEALETFARGRARREMTALLARAPTRALRYDGERLSEVPVEALRPGDRILVRRGEVLPADGRVVAGEALLDESTLTGEALPVRRAAGEAVTSGCTNLGDAFEATVLRAAADSTYAGIVRLVAAAQATRPPLARLADRFAVVFLGLTLALAGAAWLFGGPERALAVLITATPCPLILGVPIAILSGVSRCARRGVLVKGGGVLERLAGIRTVLLDKTGTVTLGRPRLLEARTADGGDTAELLRLVASLEQGSHHVAAEGLVVAARDRDLALSTPTEVQEVPGAGLSGRVDGHALAAGSWAFVRQVVCDPPPDDPPPDDPPPDDPPLDALGPGAALEAWCARHEGTMAVAAALDGRIAGAFVLADEVRPEAGTVLRHLRDAGVRRIVLATGDRRGLAASVAAFLGADAVLSEQRPEDKVAAVVAEKAGGPVLMVGDGINDAPALAAADVGVAMGARGAVASTEAADVVVLDDRLDRLVDALRISRRSRRIALQSAGAGMGLSLLAMIAAALGFLQPVQGALLQEAIDVAVVLNALRALGRPLLSWRRQAQLTPEDLLALEAEHRALAGVVDGIRIAAERIHTAPPDRIRPILEALEKDLSENLLPHEQDDDRLYARLRREGGADVLAGMSRTHMEIRRRVEALRQLHSSLGEPDAARRHEILRSLHGLEAITRLHFAQEEEIYRALERP